MSKPSRLRPSRRPQCGRQGSHSAHCPFVCRPSPATFPVELPWETRSCAAERKPAHCVFVVAGFALSACEPHQDLRATLSGFCVDCHNDAERTAELTFESRRLCPTWPRMPRSGKSRYQVRTGTMPPSDEPQPSAEDRSALAAWLETSLDDAAAANPNPGRTETFRRLNRTEYQNAIRDLLALDIDATALLPPDESGYGFDNVNVGDLSPALLDRYIAAAQKISRLAVGSTQASLQSDVISVPPDATRGRARGRPADW